MEIKLIAIIVILGKLNVHLALRPSLEVSN